jgi:hypothetical protein
MVVLTYRFLGLNNRLGNRNLELFKKEKEKVR